MFLQCALYIPADTGYTPNVPRKRYIDLYHSAAVSIGMADVRCVCGMVSFCDSTNVCFAILQRIGVTIMENKKKNTNIKCSVTQCKHNMVTENYCGLDCICVGTHELNPTVPECTNCDSFVKRSAAQG